MRTERAVRAVAMAAVVVLPLLLGYLFLMMVVLPVCGLAAITLAWAVHSHTADGTWRWDRLVRGLAWVAGAVAAVGNVAASAVWFSTTDVDGAGTDFPAWTDAVMEIGFGAAVVGLLLVAVLLVAVWPSPAERRRRLAELAARHRGQAPAGPPVGPGRASH